MQRICFYHCKSSFDFANVTFCWKKLFPRQKGAVKTLKSCNAANGFFFEQRPLHNVLRFDFWGNLQPLGTINTCAGAEKWCLANKSAWPAGKKSTRTLVWCGIISSIKSSGENGCVIVQKMFFFTFFSWTNVASGREQLQENVNKIPRVNPRRPENSHQIVNIAMLTNWSRLLMAKELRRSSHTLDDYLAVIAKKSRSSENTRRSIEPTYARWIFQNTDFPLPNSHPPRQHEPNPLTINCSNDTCVSLWSAVLIKVKKWNVTRLIPLSNRRSLAFGVT